MAQRLPEPVLASLLLVLPKRIQIVSSLTWALIIQDEYEILGKIHTQDSNRNNIDFYTWTRDSALTLRMIVDEYILGNGDLVQYIEDYLSAQAALQTITNPSGTFLPDGEGLGEPKYMVDGTRFNGAVSFFVCLFQFSSEPALLFI